MMIILGGGVALSWLERRVSDRNVVGSMPVLDINANYLTGTLCGVENELRNLFHKGIYRRRNETK